MNRTLVITGPRIVISAAEREAEVLRSVAGQPPVAPDELSDGFAPSLGALRSRFVVNKEKTPGESLAGGESEILR
jgi:hypothetical protein